MFRIRSVTYLKRERNLNNFYHFLFICRDVSLKLRSPHHYRHGYFNPWFLDNLHLIWTEIDYELFLDVMMTGWKIFEVWFQNNFEFGGKTNN